MNINSPPNGTVTADRDPAQYFEGDKVTLSVSSDNGYILDTIEIDAQVVVLNDDYTFIMPSGDVTVRAVFKEADIEEWDSDRTISETEVIYNGVYVEHDMTLTIESGTSLTVYNGINISEGCTLTINGAGILKVYGREGEHGESLSIRPGGAGGTDMASVYGKVVVN